MNARRTRYGKPREPMPLASAPSAASASSASVASPRRRLPDTRAGVTFTIRLAGISYHFTAGRFPDGTCGELFSHARDADPTMAGLLDSLAIVISLALQHGTPLAVIAAKLKSQRFPPAGPTGDAARPLASSIVDALAHRLEREFLPPPADSAGAAS